MSSAAHVDNRVKSLRQARGWSQNQLAQAASLSRTGVSAIEAARLVPSVAAALGLAAALGTTVEDLFGQPPPSGSPEFAWLPGTFPCRYWMAEIAGRTLLFPVESGPRGDLLHDGIAQHERDFPERLDAARRTLVLASCDPAAGYLASAYERRSGGRMLVFTRTSSEALDLVDRGLAHVAGVHFAAADERRGNADHLARRGGGDLSLVHVARWEEGLASRPAERVRSAAAAARSKLRWVGRPRGAASLRYQDALLGRRRPPRHIARDHRGVAEAIRSGWADVGVCHRLASEDGQLAFLSLGEENYDLLFRRELAAEERITHLVAVIRSREYLQLLTDLPGYHPQRSLGEIEHVPHQS